MIPYNAENDYWLTQDWVTRVLDKLWNHSDSIARRHALLTAILPFEVDFENEQIAQMLDRAKPRDFDTVNDKHLEMETINDGN